MTRRALQFAYEQGELKEEFFYWTDTQAYDYLLHDCNPKTQQIAGTAADRQPYSTVTDLVITDPSDNFSDLCGDSDNREVVADDLAEEFSIPREDVCVYFGKSRNFRDVDIPVLGGSKTPVANGIVQEWTAQAFVHPAHDSMRNKVDKAFRERVGV